MYRQHTYNLTLQWIGYKGTGTTNYRAYDRAHTISVEGKPILACSADPAFLGDQTKYNPEELFLASLASCHMLWYLHLCADAGICVTAYTDQPTGFMEKRPGGGGRFTEVVLRPVVTISDPSAEDAALELHGEAHKHCFIANSCNFPVRNEPVCKGG